MDYLKSIEMDTILQQLVRDALDAKPEDALQFAADWTKKKIVERKRALAQKAAAEERAESGDAGASSGDGSGDSARGGASAGGRVLASHSIAVHGADADEVDMNDPQSVVMYSWRMRAETEDESFVSDFSVLVLNVLFAQHPSLERMFLTDPNVTVNDAAAVLAAILTAMLVKNQSPEAVAKLAMQKFNAFAPSMSKQSGLLLLVRERHLHYLMCAVLYAAECIYSAATWRKIGFAWLTVLAKYLDGLKEAIFSEQLVTASLVEKDALDSEFEQAMLVSPTTLVRQGPVDIVKGIWLSLSSARQEKICRKFFAVLFTQHRTVVRHFVDEDDDSGAVLVDQAPVKELQVILTQVLRGFLSLEGVTKIASDRAPIAVQQRHLHYGLSCMLTALNLELGQDVMKGEVAGAWRQLLTRLLDAVAAGLPSNQDNGEPDPRDYGGAGAGGAATAGAAGRCSQNEESDDINRSVDCGLKLKMDDKPKLELVSAGSSFNVAAECWSAIRSGSSGSDLSEMFLNILFTQHPALSKTVLRNPTEHSALIAYLPALFEGVVGGTISESDLRELGAKLLGRSLDEQKAEHACAAAMTVFALSLGIGTFREREAALHEVINYITGNVLYGVNNSAAVLAGRAPEVIVHECWLGIVDKEAVIKKAIEVMRIQHRSLTRDALEGLDVDAFAKDGTDLVTRVLGGKLSEAEAAELVGKLQTKCEGRPIEKKHMMYMTSSFQAAVNIILGSRFEFIQKQWNTQMEKAATTLGQSLTA